MISRGDLRIRPHLSNINDAFFTSKSAIILEIKHNLEVDRFHH